MKLSERKSTRNHEKAACEKYSSMTTHELEQEIEQLWRREDAVNKMLAINCILSKLRTKKRELDDELKQLKKKL